MYPCRADDKKKVRIVARSALVDVIVDACDPQLTHDSEAASSDSVLALGLSRLALYCRHADAAEQVEWTCMMRCPANRAASELSSPYPSPQPPVTHTRTHIRVRMRMHGHACRYRSPRVAMQLELRLKHEAAKPAAARQVSLPPLQMLPHKSNDELLSLQRAIRGECRGFVTCSFAAVEVELSTEHCALLARALQVDACTLQVDACARVLACHGWMVCDGSGKLRALSPAPSRRPPVEPPAHRAAIHPCVRMHSHAHASVCTQMRGRCL